MTMNVQLVDELREAADWFRLRGLNENAALLDHVAHTVQCVVGRIERDEALLRQSLGALECMVRTTGDTLEIPGVTHPSLTSARTSIAGLRERLGVKA